MRSQLNTCTGIRHVCRSGRSAIMLCASVDKCDHVRVWQPFWLNMYCTDKDYLIVFTAA